MRERGSYLLMLLSIPALWWGIIGLFRPDPLLFPPPGMVLDVLREDAGEIGGHTLRTLRMAGIGFLLSNVVAVGLAVAYFYVGWLESLATPWMVVAKNIPFPAIAGILYVLTQGNPFWPVIIVVVLINFFPILANTVKGLQSVDPVLRDRLRTLHASRRQVLMKACAPAAIPYFIAAQEVSFTGSIIGAIVGEWLFSFQGIGAMMEQARTNYRTDELFAYTLVSSLLAIVAYFLVRSLERHLFRWKRDG